MGADSNVTAPRFYLKLVQDPTTGALDVTGETPNLDVSINILQQALRECEWQWRQSKMVQMQARLAAETHAASIRSMIEKRS